MEPTHREIDAGAPAPTTHPDGRRYRHSFPRWVKAPYISAGLRPNSARHLPGAVNTHGRTAAWGGSSSRHRRAAVAVRQPQQAGQTAQPLNGNGTTSAEQNYVVRE